MVSKAENFLSSSGALVYVSWDLSDTTKIVEVSDSVEDALGWTPAQLLEDPTMFSTLVHESDVHNLFDALQDRIAQAAPTKHLHYPVRIRNVAGIWRWHAVITQLELEDDTIKGVHSVITDIHEQNLRSLELKESEKRLELVLEGTRLGMWDWYPQTNDVRFNERWAEMLGYSIDEIEMNLNTWESKVHPDDLASCYADITAHMEGRVPFYENIHRMKHKDGTWRYILDRGKIVQRDKEGNPIRFTGTHTDITAQKTAETNALEASRAKSKFLAHMSHEIRTPLNGVLGMADVLADMHLSQDQAKTLKVLKESGTHLQSVLNDILDFSKIEEGALSFNNEVFSVKELVNKAILLFSEKAKDKGVEMIAEVTPRVEDVRIGDTTRIRQVIYNLLSNALKFTNSGSVRLVVDGSDERLLLSVADTGVGMKDTKGIFDRFKQADSSVTKQYGGTGLGLAITARLVEMMQGSISVDSTVGKGSTFNCDLLVPVSKQQIEHYNSDSIVSDKAKQLRVLVAEDNPTNQLVIEKSLEFLGISCKIVENGQLAVDAVETKDFDLVLMDLHMPILGGYEAAKRIREIKNAKGASSPEVVALTADVMTETRDQCHEVGMIRLLGKPFQRRQLIELLNEVAHAN